jgi:AbrB family looped-hinge helix DNA binding protein
VKIFPRPKLLAVAQLNEKSQMVIPKEARDAIGIGPGDRVIVALAPLGKALVIARPEDIEKYLGDTVILPGSQK